MTRGWGGGGGACPTEHGHSCLDQPVDKSERSMGGSPCHSRAEHQ